MKAYTCTSTTCTAGILVTANDDSRRTIALGEKGRGRVHTLVPVEAPVEDGRLYKAAPARVGGRLALLPEQNDDGRILVRASADGAYTRGRAGKVTPLFGEVTVLAEGSGADGDAGNIGRWADVLLIAKAPCAFEINPGNGKNPRVTYVLAAPDAAPRGYAPEEGRTAISALCGEGEAREAHAAEAERRGFSRLAEAIRAGTGLQML